MQKVVLLLGLVSMAAAFTTTTHHPHSTPSMVGGELDHQIRAEVKVLLQQDPNLNVDNCSTKCDALFDLVSHHHEKTTDELCLYKCRGAINGHHHHHTTTILP